MFFLKRYFGLNLSGKYPNTTRNCVKMFRAHTHLSGAKKPPKQVPRRCTFTTLYKDEKYKINSTFFLSPDFGLKLSGTFPNTANNSVDMLPAHTHVFRARPAQHVTQRCHVHFSL